MYSGMFKGTYGDMVHRKEVISKTTDKAYAVVIKRIHALEKKIEDTMERWPEQLYGCKGEQKCEKFREEIADLQKWMNDAQNSDAARAENDRLKAVIQNTIQRLYSVEETARTYWDTHEQNNVKGIIKDLQDVL